MSSRKPDYQEQMKAILAGSKGKTRESADKRGQFTEAWVGMAAKTGVDASAVNYLYKGFHVAGAEPVYRLAEAEHSTTPYMKLFMSLRTTNNKDGCALKVVMNLFALELIKPTSGGSLDWVASRIPNLATGNDGRMREVLNQQIGPLIVRPIAGKSIHLSACLDAAHSSGLLSLLKEPIESYATSDSATAADAIAAQGLIDWLESQVPDADSSSMCAVTSSTQDDAPKTADATRVQDESVLTESTATMVQSEEVREPQTRSPEQLIEKESNDSGASRQKVSEKTAKQPAGQDLDMDTVLAFLSSYLVLSACVLPFLRQSICALGRDDRPRRCWNRRSIGTARNVRRSVQKKRKGRSID